HPGAEVPGVRPVVRHDADARLASAVQRRSGGLRPSAHSPGDLARRRPVRGMLGRLSARMAGIRAPRRLFPRPAADPAGARGQDDAAVIEDILPSPVVAEEAFGDLPDVMLFPDEEAVIAKAVGKRRNEFTTA